MDRLRSGVREAGRMNWPTYALIVFCALVFGVVVYGAIA
jgi:hypothetical protein